MLSKTLAAPMRLVRKIDVESLMNLIVMLSILSVSCHGKDTRTLGQKIKGLRFNFKPANAESNFDEYGKFDEDGKTKNKSGSGWKWVFSSLSAWFNVFLLVGILAALLIPGTSEGNIVGDNGQSFFMRLGFIIPASVVILGSMFVGYRRFGALQAAKSAEKYKETVQTKQDVTILLGAVTFVSLVMFGVVLGANMGAFKDASINPAMTVCTALCLAILFVGGFASTWYSYGKASKFGEQAKKHNAIRRDASGLQRKVASGLGANPEESDLDYFRDTPTNVSGSQNLRRRLCRN